MKSQITGILLLFFLTSAYGIHCICNAPSIRGSDRHGQGYFGAPRGNRFHRGVDVKCGSDGTADKDIYAPFDGYILRYSSPYASPSTGQRTINKGLVFCKTRTERACYSENEVTVEKRTLYADCFKMFYVNPIPFNRNNKISAGEKIGKSLDMQLAYPGITNHVHVQTAIDSSIDPTRKLNLRGCE